MPEQNLRKLYENLNSSGRYDLPEWDQFVVDMADSSNKRSLYNTLKEDQVWDLPTFDKFSDDIYVGKSDEERKIAKKIDDLPLAPGVFPDFVTARQMKSFGKGITTTVHGLGGFLRYLGMEETGENVTSFIEDLERNYLEVNDPTYVDEVIQGFGSAASFFIPGIGVAKGAALVGTIAPRIAALLGTSVSAVLESAVESGVTYEEALSKGDDPSRAREKATQTFGLNLPINFVLDKYFFAEQVGKRLYRALRGAASEGTQEYFQELISTFAQGDGIISSALGLFSAATQGQALRAGSIGSIVGGGISGVRSEQKEIDPKITNLVDLKRAQEEERAKRFGAIQREAKQEEVQRQADIEAQERLQILEEEQPPIELYERGLPINAEDIVDMPAENFASLIGLPLEDAQIVQSAISSDELLKESGDVLGLMDKVQQEAEASIDAEGDPQLRKEILDSRKDLGIEVLEPPLSEKDLGIESQIEPVELSEGRLSDYLPEGEIPQRIEPREKFPETSRKPLERFHEIKIPDFLEFNDKSGTAYEWGLSNQNNPAAEQALKARISQLRQEKQQIESQPRTLETVQEGLRKGFAIQMYNEALSGVQNGPNAIEHKRLSTLRERNAARQELGLPPIEEQASYMNIKDDKDVPASIKYIIKQAERIMGDARRVKFVENFESNPAAVGRFYNGMVEYILGKSTKETAHHEPIHYWLNHLTDQWEYDLLYDHFKTGTPRETEEAIVNAAVDYDMKRQTFTGKVKDIFEKFWDSVKRMFNVEISKDQTIRGIFSRIGKTEKFKEVESIAQSIGRDITERFHVPENNEQQQSQGDFTEDNDVDEESYGDSVEQEPYQSLNSVITSLVNQGVIQENEAESQMQELREMAGRYDTAAAFTDGFKRKFSSANIPDSDLYSAYRTERELEEVDVLDLDVVIDPESGRISYSVVNKSFFIDHNGKKLGNRYLINSVLKPVKDKIGFVKIYKSQPWKKGEKGDVPYNRIDSYSPSDVRSSKMWESIEDRLNEKGYTLLPVSDSNTFMVVKINGKKYGRRVNETAGEHRRRLANEMAERYPRHATNFRVKDIRRLMAELSFDDFMKDALGYWYNQDLEANKLAKRFKMFLPKGEPLEYTRDINIAIADDIVYTVLSTDGNTLLNPKFANSFFRHNRLGDIKQHKTFITEKNDDFLIGVKHMAHVATDLEWAMVTEKSGVNPNVDMIVFDSAAKIAVDKNGKPLEKARQYTIKPSSIRHIFSGRHHVEATFSRQIFNFIKNPKIIDVIRDKLIDTKAKNVKKSYDGYVKNPETLLDKLKSIITNDPVDVSDFRRYVRLGSVFFKTIRTEVKRYLKNDLIDTQYIKLKQDGNFSYLKPDYFNEAKRGEVFLPFSELNKIAAMINFNVSKEASIEDAVRAINELLQKMDFEVLTFRPPISRAGNIQVLKVRKILPESAGNAVVMNSEDAVINKESDYDGDEIFYHYKESENGMDQIIEEVKNNIKPVEQIPVTEFESGSGVLLENRIQAAMAAGISKSRIGMLAKVLNVKSILQANKAKIVKLKSGDYVLVDENVNSELFEETYPLKSDLSEWEKDMAITVQATVDNLKLNSVSSGSEWRIEKDGHITLNVTDVYAKLFDGDISHEGVRQALATLRDALNIFSIDFRTGRRWDQDSLAKKAREYIRYIDNYEMMGKSAQEFMIRHMQDMGYLLEGGSQEQTINAYHDNSHQYAIGEFRRVYVKDFERVLPEKTKKKIEDKVFEVYKRKKQLEEERGYAGQFYSDLYNEYKPIINKLTAAQRRYWDYIMLRGFEVYSNGNKKSNRNTRFIMHLVSDESLQAFSNIFNDHYITTIKRNEAAFSSLFGVPFFGAKGHTKLLLEKALYKLLGDTFVNLKYRRKENDPKDVPLDSAIMVLDSINKNLMEIGRLPFSEYVNIKALYRYVLNKRGKTLEDELTAGDAAAILVEVKHLRRNLNYGNLHRMKQYLYFTQDILRNNPITAPHAKHLIDATNEKDALAEKLQRKISNRAQRGEEGVRELLDHKRVNNRSNSAMHAATKVLDLYNELKYYKLTKQSRKEKRVERKIEKLLLNKDVARQVTILEDLFRALDGQFGEEHADNAKAFVSMHGDNARMKDSLTKAYWKARELLDEVLRLDQETWDYHIGPHNREYHVVDGKRVKSWQYARMQTLREKLREHGLRSEEIEHAVNMLKVERTRAWKNYVKHSYLGIEHRDGADLNNYKILQAIEEISAKDLSDRVKVISSTKKRFRTHQDINEAADRNIVTILMRRADETVNYRWANRFRRIYHNMLVDLNQTIKNEQNKPNVIIRNVETLEKIRGLAEAMYKDVSQPQDFGFWRSLSSILRGLTLSSLLLIRTSTIVRNVVSQGLNSNIVNFGGFWMAKTLYKNKRGESKEIVDEKGQRATVGGNPGDIVLHDEPNSPVKNLYSELGIARADIFAKVEGGQEWDFYKVMERVQEFNAAMESGKLSLKAKIYLKHLLIDINTKMAKFTKTVGENNVLTLMYGVGKRFTYRPLNLILPEKWKIPVPELPKTSLSFKGGEYLNRRITGLLAFYKRWYDIEQSGGELNERSFNDAVRFAQDTIDNIQFNYNLWNKPIALRRLPTVFQFKSFTLGMIRLHWKWATDIKDDPRGEFRKGMWFATMMALILGAEKWLDLGLWRFFEIPQWEYMRDLYKSFYGNKKEKERAFYGNRLSPVSGPSVSLGLEALIAIEAMEADSDRRKEAWYRTIEALVPGAKELNNVYLTAYDIATDKRDFGNATLQYFGFYPLYEQSEGYDGYEGGYKPERYEGPVREFIKRPFIIPSGKKMLRLFHQKKRAY